MITPLESSLRAALLALARGPAPRSPQEATPVVQQYGDALRLGIAPPMALRAQLHALPFETLRAIADNARHDLEAPPTRVGEDDPAFAFALRQRDEIESVRIGLHRIALSRGLATDEIDAVAALGDALERYDLALAAVIDRGRAELVLGERMQLQPGEGWLARLPHRASDAEPVEAARVETPTHITPEALTAWASRGAGAKHIERWAAHPENAHELRSLLEQLLGAGASVGIIARRWLRRQQSGSDDVTIALRPPVRLAASTQDTPRPESNRLELGELAPLRAIGTLIVDAADSTLVVRGEPGVVQRVQFGSAVCAEPDARRRWVSRVAAPHGPLELTVESTAGASFRCTVLITPISEE
jgi:hypothetical protein